MPLTDFQAQLLAELARGQDELRALQSPELLKRRGRYRPEASARLDLVESFDLSRRQIATA